MASRAPGSRTHTALVEACLELLRRRHVPAWKQNTGAMLTPRGSLVRFAFPGCPDIIGVVPPVGTFLGIECKTGSGRLTEHQEAFRSMVCGVGGAYLEVRDVGELNEWLNGRNS